MVFDRVRGNAEVRGDLETLENRKLA